MLIVAPMGRTNLVTLGSILFLFSIASMVKGNVAEDDAVPNAVKSAFPIFVMYRNGNVRVMSPVKEYKFKYFT